jgi:hypothetical protein
VSPECDRDFEIVNLDFAVKERFKEAVLVGNRSTGTSEWRVVSACDGGKVLSSPMEIRSFTGQPPCGVPTVLPCPLVDYTTLIPSAGLLPQPNSYVMCIASTELYCGSWNHGDLSDTL